MVYIEKADRGSHMEQAARELRRSYIGKVVGMRDTSYIVYNVVTRNCSAPSQRHAHRRNFTDRIGATSTQHDGASINPVRSAAATSTDTSCTTAGHAATKVTASTHRIDPYTPDTRLAVRYPMSNEKFEWHKLTISASHEIKSGRYEYDVLWDDGVCNRDVAWTRLDLQRADAPASKIIWHPAINIKAPPPIENVNKPHSGEGMRVLLVMGGLFEQADSVPHRIRLRMPKIEVTVID